MIVLGERCGKTTARMEVPGIFSHMIMPAAGPIVGARMDWPVLVTGTSLIVDGGMTLYPGFATGG